MSEVRTNDYDVLVVGAGIGGMESALKLGDMGYKVLLVEREASVGGKMILLSKVFPTLDCASCISTPKMAASIHHPNVTTMTYTEVDGIEPGVDGRFKAKIRRKARYVNETTCTGCSLCETACTVAVPDQFNADMVQRRAAYIAFPQAVPKKAVIERAGSSPCSYTCPAGISAHGYVSLIRSGEYEKAFQLVLDATPLVGTLGRACYAPCEADCTRGSIEGPLPIRRLKRFIADVHYESHDGPGIEIPAPNGHRVAIVGSGPAGLTAAWQLARKGYAVKIFEAASVAGGFLRRAIPAYRLPAAVVDQDISNVTAAGVEIVTDSPVKDLAALHGQGYEAVLLATGTPHSTALGVPGEGSAGVLAGTDFLCSVKMGEDVDLAGRRVLVIGGGNVAMDTARTARRLGAADVTVVYRRSRAEMPAQHIEASEAEAEGAHFIFAAAPVAVLTNEQGAVRGLRAIKMAPAANSDATPGDGTSKASRAALVPLADSEFDIPAEVIIAAIGMSPDTDDFTTDITIGSRGQVTVNPETLQSATPWLFAAGDVVTGASDITRAAGAGRRAAFAIDRFLTGAQMTAFDLRLPVVDKTAVLARQLTYRLAIKEQPGESLSAAPTDFAEIEAPLSEAEARRGAGLCLDCGICSECGECVAICPVENCIDLRARDQESEIEVGAVVVATGFKLFAADLKPEYGFGTFKNVITGMQMDRLLAPTRPFNTILRPGDGKVPERIAYVLCTGSRDETVGNPLCSRFCCMYSIKQNQLIMGALPVADVTVHYMDIRAPGKRYDEFYEQAKAMGANYVKGRVAKITERPNGDLVVRYEDIEHGGGIAEAEYDLVVLAIGVQPNSDAQALFPMGALSTDEFDYVAETNEDANPGQTNIPGVYVSGAASGAKDIADSILHAGSTVAQVAAYLEKAKGPSAIGPLTQGTQRTPEADQSPITHASHGPLPVFVWPAASASASVSVSAPVSVSVSTSAPSAPAMHAGSSDGPEVSA
jgi:heterodisulfide reductase subunit A